MIAERLAQARSFGCETVDLTRDATLGEQIAEIVGEPEVDQAVDCVGFEARGTARTPPWSSRQPCSTPSWR